MEHGPYIAERTQKAVYIVRCLWLSTNALLEYMECAGMWITLLMAYFSDADVDNVRVCVRF
jgi:hypothetical protein